MKIGCDLIEPDLTGMEGGTRLLVALSREQMHLLHHMPHMATTMTAVLSTLQRVEALLAAGGGAQVTCLHSREGIRWYYFDMTQLRLSCSQLHHKLL